VRCACHLFPWAVPLDDAPSPPQRALRWAQIGEAGGGRALAVIGREPFDLRADLGQFEVLGDGVVAYALADAGARPPGFCARAALSEAIPGEPSAELPSSPPALRLADPGGLVPLWIDRPKGHRGRAWLFEVADGAGRPLFYPREAEAPEPVDADAEVRRRLEPTREGDGFELPYAAHELLLLRWR